MTAADLIRFLHAKHVQRFGEISVLHFDLLCRLLFLAQAAHEMFGDENYWATIPRIEHLTEGLAQRCSEDLCRRMEQAGLSDFPKVDLEKAYARWLQSEVATTC